MTKKEIIKKNITGYRRNIKQSDCMRMLEEYGKYCACLAFYDVKSKDELTFSTIEFENWWNEFIKKEDGK